MHFDGVEGVEEFDFVELEDQFSQDLFTKEWGAFTAVEEDDPEQTVVLLARYLWHEELEVVHVEFAVEELLLARRILAPWDPTHVLLTADFAERTLFLALIFQDDLEVLPISSLGNELLNFELGVTWLKKLDLSM